MIVALEALFRKLVWLVDPREWFRFFLNRTHPQETDAKSGLVMVQIDGLSFEQIKKALKNGNMPFLDRLEKREGYTIYRHYSGLPSNTPAVQGMLFYGVKSCVPAFSFKQNHTGKILNMFNPESAASIEESIKDKGEPLLKDGSAYGNIFTGGAKEAHFCASSMGWGGLLKVVLPFGLPLTFILHFHIFIRALFLVGVELILAVSDSIRGVLSGRNFIREVRYIPLRVAVCVILREVIAAGAQIDIARGLPVIHLNLAGFDEQAHHRGPSSLFAQWSLRGIDSAISKVWKSAQRSRARPYEVFIYSDHGQEDTVSYQDEYGLSAEEAVRRVFEDKAKSDGHQADPEKEARYWRANSLRNKPSQRMRETNHQKNDDLSRVIVTTMGPLGHIYPPETLSEEAKDKIAWQLVDSAKIPIVATACGPGEALAWNADGKFRLPQQGDKVIESTHPFFKEIIRDIVELCHHPDAGMFLIFGWRKGPKSLTFHGEQGSHAGPGTIETSGFALLPPGVTTHADKEGIYTQDIRQAAFRTLEREGEAAQDLLTSAERTFLRVMTYNVHGCVGRDGRLSPDRIARLIAKHNPDIVALQELASYKEAQQVQIISKKLSMLFHYHPALSIKKGQRGNAIISKFPMRLVQNGRLPKLTRAPFLEPRGALWVEINWRGERIQILNTHLSLSSHERALQMNALLGPEWLGHPACLSPVIFCGDFNALAKSKIFKNIGPYLKNSHFDLDGHNPLKTLPSFYPMGLVDHIFVSPCFKTTKIQVTQTTLEKIASDHLPLIVDIQLIPQNPIES